MTEGPTTPDKPERTRRSRENAAETFAAIAPRSEEA